MSGWEGNLKDMMIFVVDQTIRAESIANAIQAIQVAFVFIGISMNFAWNEVVGSQQWFQPWRTHTHIILPHSNNWTHLFIQTINATRHKYINKSCHTSIH